MKTITLVYSKLDIFDNYKDQFRIFSDKQKAIDFAQERAKKVNLDLMLLNKPEDLKVGTLIFAEGGDQFIKVIEVEVEE